MLATRDAPLLVGAVEGFSLALPLAVVLLLFAMGCSEATSLTVNIDGDLQWGTDFDAFRIVTSEDGAETSSETFHFAEGAPLPWSARIRPPTEVARAADLTVTALLRGRTGVTATREVDFVRGQNVEVGLCLWQRCATSTEEECAEGRCEIPSADGDGDADVDAASDADESPDADEEPDSNAPLCTEECFRAGDGRCDDGGEGSSTDLCDFGTDCADCGLRESRRCVTRSCELRECGSDGCGGSCGPGCDGSEECMPGGQCITWVEVLPEGPFLMGSPEGEVGRASNETLHEVELTRGYFLAATEASEAWYAGLTGAFSMPFAPAPMVMPVWEVSWHEAAAFVNLLSRASGLPSCYLCDDSARVACELHPDLGSPYDCEGYRLPTEAEWEHAARAGTVTATYNGNLEEGDLGCASPSPVLDPIAWFCGNATDVSPRGMLEPNAFGLYDMLGNGQEWVHDRYGNYPTGLAVDPVGPAEGSDGVIRGGWALGLAEDVRAADRVRWSKDGGGSGFRVARSRTQE